jgi:hypothetical protein
MKLRLDSQSLLRAFNGCFLWLAAAFLLASVALVFMKRPTAAVDTSAAH